MKFTGLICLGVALLVLSALPAPAHSGDVPSFLQPGKSYNMSIGGTFHENIAVLETDRGWIKVKQAGREYWLNTRFIERVFPDMRKPAKP